MGLAGIKPTLPFHHFFFVVSLLLFFDFLLSLQLSPPLEYSVLVNETVNISELTGVSPIPHIKLVYPFNLTIDSSGFIGLQRKTHLASYVKVCSFIS